ncbi:MAG: hypothetical protein P8Z35_10745 [Ignavibacteriaceae bacterium]
MRLVELIALPGALIGAFFTLITALEQRLIKRIKSISAHSENESKELSKLRPITKWRLSQLQKSKVIVKADNGEYNFDEKAYKNLNKKRVIAVVIFLIVLISLIVIIHKQVEINGRRKNRKRTDKSGYYILLVNY